jgi:hypothetical protein
MLFGKVLERWCDVVDAGPFATVEGESASTTPHQQSSTSCTTPHSISKHITPHQDHDLPKFNIIRHPQQHSNHGNKPGYLPPNNEAVN